MVAKTWEGTIISNEDIMDLNIPCETCDKKLSWGFPTVECMECMALKHREKQAEISFKAGQEIRQLEIDTTIKAILGQTPSHCNQHEKFMDECMACQDTCNENIDWKLFGRLQEIRQEERKEVIEWIKVHSQIEYCDPDVMAYFNEYRWIDEDEWQAKFKELEIENGQASTSTK